MATESALVVIHDAINLAMDSVKDHGIASRELGQVEHKLIEAKLWLGQVDGAIEALIEREAAKLTESNKPAPTTTVEPTTEASPPPAADTPTDPPLPPDVAPTPAPEPTAAVDTAAPSPAPTEAVPVTQQDVPASKPRTALEALLHRGK